MLIRFRFADFFILLSFCPRVYDVGSSHWLYYSWRVEIFLVVFFLGEGWVRGEVGSSGFSGPL
jgi:hypothetical protein